MWRSMLLEVLLTSVLSSGASVALVKGYYDYQSKKRDAEVSVRKVEASVSKAIVEADVTLRTKGIDDGAKFRQELWDRIEKLEKRQDECTEENSQLRKEISSRDGKIAQLESELNVIRDDLDETKKQLLDAQNACGKLKTELDELRGA
jgi:chromosome segregation ATPase